MPSLADPCGGGRRVETRRAVCKSALVLGDSGLMISVAKPSNSLAGSNAE
jgi:hypothetical protein